MSGDVWAIVVGAGSGVRFGGDVPKQFRRLAGVPVFRRALRAFVDHPMIDGVVPVIGAADGVRYAETCADPRAMAAVTGGSSRAESVRNALHAIHERGPARVLIHDAARPLVSTRLIERVVRALDAHDAVVPGLAVRDTLKRVDDGLIEDTVDRNGLVAVQTPQGFDYQLLCRAHATDVADTATDDAMLVERLGVPVHVVEGEFVNMKITDPPDLAHAARFLDDGVLETRVGTGFDVHRLEPGDAIVLGGLTLASPARAIGHSDADVALHALTDALLGTLGDGDIGTLFPPSEDRWRGADSALFLREACHRVRARGGELRHLDLTILCERPKIGPHRDAMRARIAAIVELEVARVSVKATTTEQLGFTGRGEGIAAQAVATVGLPVG
ncbi:MAG: bifunctional 2-C-methyl-D-erythritol 4-phosphate cytidylyltransferase/2-C-methyl-D-erythritol 2,4-cyclodiphosphate synthase [Pseudomonadota bacterium]